MKTTVTREAAHRRQPRMQSSTRPATPPAPRAQSDWAWPGFTRAELRDHIIEQIG